MSQPTMPPYPGGAAVIPPKKKRGPLFWVLLAVGIVLLLIIVSCAAVVGTAVNGASKGLASASASAAAATEQATDDATDEAADEPTEEAPDDPTEEPAQGPTKAPEKSAKQKAYDALSDEQQEAVGEGQDYLETQGFSKQGLIDQLDSDYGSQYSKKDAVKAVAYLEDHGGVDWNKQAVRAAKSYRETMHFSTQALIDQLDSDYGGQFTHSQAVYGVKHSR